ncbi:MAG: DUF3122 domain-containing protein [Phormidesmis sp.]
MLSVLLLTASIAQPAIALPATTGTELPTNILSATTLLATPMTAPMVALLATPIASIHTYNEKPGQTTFRSKQSLRDRSDRSWQVILFKRYQGDRLQGLYLRLIGFPGVVALDPQKSLTIATGSSTQWQASPELDPQTQALPENVAQYNVAEAIDALQGDIPLQVEIPLANGSIAQLVVPPFAVQEWRKLNGQIPDGQIPSQ